MVYSLYQNKIIGNLSILVFSEILSLLKEANIT